MSYALALFVGAWLILCFKISRKECRALGISRAAAFWLTALGSLAWPITVGMCIRHVALLVSLRKRKRGMEA